jgi:hypothetical protein
MPDPKEHELHPFDTVEQAVEAIQQAIESEEHVRLQTTDLNLLRWFLDENNQRKGRLVLVNDRTGERATKTITFAVAPPAGKFIIPWVAESITDMMTNGQTYLGYKDGGVNCRVYFEDVEEMYFGEVKAFMVCVGKEYEKDEH